MGGMGAGAAAAQLGNDMLNQSMGFGLSAKSASIDWDRYKNSITRGMLYRMEGLDVAGLNPIMAVSGGLAAGSPQLPKVGPTRTGGSVGNPALQGAQIRAANAQAAQATNAAELLRVQGIGVGLDNVGKKGLADFLSTPAGIASIIRQEINKSLPDTWSGMAGKSGFDFKSTAKDLWDQHSPNFTPDWIRRNQIRREQTPSPRKTTPIIGPNSKTGK